MAGREPGWDSKEIKRIVEERYGGYANMFEAHGWPERGSEIMPGHNKRVADRYGSITAFIAAHHPGLAQDPATIWDQGLSVMLTSFWGWSPHTWGTVGFTVKGRLPSVVSQTTDPFIMVVYVTKGARGAAPEIKGKVTGFYLVSHIPGHRDEFTHPDHHGRNPEKWQHSLLAIRAFDFLPEYRIKIGDLDPTVAKRARDVARSGEFVRPEVLSHLKELPYREVEVFGGARLAEPRIVVPKAGRGLVRSGPANRSGYLVSGEPRNTEKELYVLRLDGNTDGFLGEAASGRRICKVGLSISPQSRLDAFRKSMPLGAYTWMMHRSTRIDGHASYPCFEAAEAGEMAMKKSFVSQKAKWLGGEFYAATASQMEAAWDAGRKAALSWRGKQG